MASPRITLDHIAIAVDGLEAATKIFRKVLQADASPPEEVPGEKVRLSFLDLGGARIELLEATSPESPVAGFLASGKRGVHHLSFRLEGIDIEDWYQDLKQSGVEVLGPGPRPGAGGTTVIFLHPRSTGGVLVEFSQGPKKEP